MVEQQVKGFFYQHLILLEKIFSKKRKRKKYLFQNWEPGKYYLASLNFGGLEDTKSFNVSEKISSSFQRSFSKL